VWSIDFDFTNISSSYIELRQEIYHLVLPSTLRSSQHINTTTIWIKGCTSLLQVSRQLHEECAGILYGTNTIEVDIKYDSIKFHYTWLLPFGLKPKALYPFFTHFSPRNIGLIRNYVINVEHVDSYQGMIKYNCGGPGLTAGVLSQVRNFVREIGEVRDFGRVVVRLSNGNRVLSDIRRVRVHCMERGKNMEETQRVLDPFEDMKGIRWAQVEGSVTREYAARIEQAMTGCSMNVDSAVCVAKTDEVNLDPAVLWRWKNSWNA
jgi:hypothetical protein